MKMIITMSEVEWGMRSSSSAYQILCFAKRSSHIAVSGVHPVGSADRDIELLDYCFAFHLQHLKAPFEPFSFGAFGAFGAFPTPPLLEESERYYNMTLSP